MLLAQLSPPYREALRLFYLEEKSYEEVSAMLGLPIGTVKTYLHRARKQLARSLTRVAKVTA
jgi:RNA polymerase sigma-70 factor (ECF subfamily)